MMGLPHYIEACLLEAGLTATEIAVLNRLLQNEAMTLREMAAATGKSTGVLSQAVKKLIRRKILSRERINDKVKYTLSSVDAVFDWVRYDINQKYVVLKRKEYNFSSFIESIKVENIRPEMQYFEGFEGIKKAYEKLLSVSREMLHYFPIIHNEEDDPLCDFKRKLLNKRRKDKVFSRIIAHDSSLSRRFKERDHFEYRETLLVPRDACPIAFEKIIVGDTIACINHREQRVCFIRFPELAKVERDLFEVLWEGHSSQSMNKRDTSAQKRVLSGNQYVFNKPHSLLVSKDHHVRKNKRGILAFCSVVVTFMTYGFYIS